MIKKFIIYFLIYYFPPIILHGLIILPPIISKLSMLEYVHNSNCGYIYHPNTIEEIFKYKLDTILDKDFDIIVIGSSRVNQFRKEMFSEDVDFFNLCHMGNGNENYLLLLKYIIQYQKPKVIILGIDQWLLNDNYPNGEKNDYNSNSIYKSDTYNYYKDYYNNLNYLNPGYDSINGINLIGSQAVTNLHGFRSDGSWFYGKRFYKIINRQKFIDEKNTILRINDGVLKFQFGENIKKTEIQALKEIIRICKNNNIELIGFFPPFPNSINLIMDNSGRYDYLKKSKILLHKLFKENEFNFYDYTRIDEFDDNYYIDGLHGNQNIYYSILDNLSLRSKDIDINKNFENGYYLNNSEKRILLKKFQNSTL
jgi:hypothetical protein